MRSNSCFPSALKELIHAKSKPLLSGECRILAENSTSHLRIFSVTKNKNLLECLGVLTLGCYGYKQEEVVSLTSTIPFRLFLRMRQTEEEKYTTSTCAAFCLT